jgi:hypothetical protein
VAVGARSVTAQGEVAGAALTETLDHGVLLGIRERTVLVKMVRVKLRNLLGNAFCIESSADVSSERKYQDVRSLASAAFSLLKALYGLIFS